MTTYNPGPVPDFATRARCMVNRRQAQRMMWMRAKQAQEQQDE